MGLVVRHTMQALRLRSMSKIVSGYSQRGKIFRLSTIKLAILGMLLANVPAGTLSQTPAPARSVKVDSVANKTLIDETIPEDKGLEATLERYTARVRALEVVIGKLDGDLKKTGLGAGTLGNFVADGLRAEAGARLGRPVVLAVLNSGGLRKNTIAEGDLRSSDIYELLPFENELIQIDMTGEQVLRLLSVVVANREVQSGARITFRQAGDRRELVSAKLLVNGREEAIDPKRVYSILTIDYLLQLASGRYSILQEGKNVKPVGVTMRDALIDYVKSETAAGRSIKAELDGRFVSLKSDTSSHEEQ